MKLTFTSMLVLCSIVPLATGTQKVRDGVITYPGGYTIEEGTPFVLPPPMKEAGYATDAIILNGPEPEVMAPWVGGTHVNRVQKGDAGTGDPLVPVDVMAQREALAFIVENGAPIEFLEFAPSEVGRNS